MRPNIFYSTSVAVCFCIVFLSCKKHKLPTPQDLKSQGVLASNVVETYADIVLASYEDSLEEAKRLKDSIDGFVRNPTEKGLKNVKQVWRESREPYLQTEAYRFADGPIDANDGTPESLINAWPLDESYVDYVRPKSPDVIEKDAKNDVADSNTDIINDKVKFPNLNKDLLEKLNEAEGKDERAISVGYHAIEFLLWGQDSETPQDGDVNDLDATAGQRPYTDFVDGDAGTAQNQDRRRQYLKLCAEDLVDKLQFLVDSWAKDRSGNYRTKFLGFSSKDALGKIITGMATLLGPELSGERVYVALKVESQEDEHSCFSDNSHRDIRLNFKGAKNVYEGTYKRIGGKVVGSKSSSLEELLEKIDPDLESKVDELFKKAENSVEATHIPFDFAVTSKTYQPAVDRAARDIATLAKKLYEVGASIGVNASFNSESDHFTASAAKDK